MDSRTGIRRIISTIMIVAMIAMTAFAAATLDVDAASKKAKKIKLTATATSYTVTLKWNKIKSPKKGYAVFKDGKCVKRLSKKKTTYKVSVKPGETHSFQIKRWTKKKKKFKYSKPSNIKRVTAPAAGQQNNYGTTGTISSNGDATLNVGDSYQLNAKSSSGDTNFNYSSSNYGVAGVDSSGLVSAYSTGVAVITISPVVYSSDAYCERKVTITVVQGNVTVSFDSNGGIGTMSNQTLVNGKGTLKANEFTREHYRFKGWSKTSNGFVSYTDGQTVTIQGRNITLYAVWEKLQESTGEFKFTKSYINNVTQDNWLNRDDGEQGYGTAAHPLEYYNNRYEVPFTYPSCTQSIAWTINKTPMGQYDCKECFTLYPQNGGKGLYIEACDSLSPGGIFGQAVLTGTLTVRDGYEYTGPTKITRVITNSVFKLEENTTSPIIYTPMYIEDGAHSNYPEERTDGPSIHPELRLNNSTVKINLKGSKYDHYLTIIYPGNDGQYKYEIKTPSAQFNTFINTGGMMILAQAGTFSLYYPELDKTINYKITGNNPDAVSYLAHLEQIKNNCQGLSEMERVQYCVKYCLMHYRYDSGDLFEQMYMFMHGYGDCGAAADWLCDALRYQGMDAHVRGAAGEKWAANAQYHFNVGVMINGEKYVADATPYSTPITNEENADYETEQKIYTYSSVSYSGNKW